MLVSRLGDDSCEIRDAAEKEILERGPLALEALAAGKANADIEIRARSTEIWDRIQWRHEGTFWYVVPSIDGSGIYSSDVSGKDFREVCIGSTFALDPKGTNLAIGRGHFANTIVIRDLRTGLEEELGSNGSLESDLIWNCEGSHLAWMWAERATLRDEKHLHLMDYDLNDRSIEDHPVPRAVANRTELAWDPSGDKVFMLCQFDDPREISLPFDRKTFRICALNLKSSEITVADAKCVFRRLIGSARSGAVLGIIELESKFQAVAMITSESTREVYQSTRLLSNAIEAIDGKTLYVAERQDPNSAFDRIVVFNCETNKCDVVHTNTEILRGAVLRCFVPGRSSLLVEFQRDGSTVSGLVELPSGNVRLLAPRFKELRHVCFHAFVQTGNDCSK